MKALKSCTFGKVYKGLPGLCITLTFAITIAIAGGLGYLFFTQEILKDSSSNDMLPIALRPTQSKTIRQPDTPGNERNVPVNHLDIIPASHIQ